LAKELSRRKRSFKNKGEEQAEEQVDNLSVQAPLSLPASGEIENEKQLRKMYSTAVEYGLSLLGKELGDVALSYLALRYRMSIDQSYDDPRRLCLALENALGFSSIVVQKRIIRSLNSQMGLGPDGPSNMIIRLGHPEDFVNLIQEAIQSFRQSRESPK
jgi:hypothetical protein